MKRVTCLWILFLLILLPACESSPHPSATSSLVPTVQIQSAPSALPSATSSSIPTIPPLPVTPAPTSSSIPTIPPLPVTSSPTSSPQTSTPAPRNFSHPQVITQIEALPNPDDLLTAPDGSLYISDVGDGSIRRYLPGGRLETIAKGLSEPEGMVLLPGGSLVIAEQGRNRLVRLDLQTGRLTPFLNLKNTTGQAGVDGIALDARDPAHPSLIIPDSPNGTVLRANLDGTQVQQIAGGFTRPTAAWVEADGSILVADEYGHSLARVRPDGSVQTLARGLPTPDDVVEDSAGRIFVNTLGDGAVHMLSTDGKQDVVIISGLSSPQGETLDAQGNLLVTDPGNHRVVRVNGSGK